MEKITYLNWHDVEDLRLTKEQKGYLPDNVSNLALAGVIREAGFHVFTFGIYLGEKPIRFVMIGYDIPLDPEDDLNVRGFPCAETRPERHQLVRECDKNCDQTKLAAPIIVAY
ncbi:MAG: hypothetical protein K6A68_09600 [Clostridiales bacterium]|nr:hypothetical protein [Clostridiales bacterium]